MLTAMTSRASSTTDNTETRPNLAPLTEASIASCTDSGSFSRGRRYKRAGHIFDAVRRGSTLRAQCHGSRPHPYLVEATLALAGEATPSNPVSVSCDCPRGGFCKHIVALLLTWVDAPESFAPRPAIATLLADKSRDDLIALVELLLRNEPWLEQLVEVPLPVAGVVSDTPVDEVAIRQQIDAVFRGHDDHGWSRDAYGFHEDDAATRIAADLQPLLDLAAAYDEAGYQRNALRVLVTLTDSLIAQDDTFPDELGDLSPLLLDCDRQLSPLLGKQAKLPESEQLSRDERFELVRALFAIWHGNADAGGHRFSRDGHKAIIHHATTDEIALVSEWLRGLVAAPPPDLHSRRCMVSSAVEFLTKLPGETGFSAEEALDAYRESELWAEAAVSLVSMGKIEEGIALAARRITGAYELSRFATFVANSDDATRVEQAIALVDARLWEEEGKHPTEDEIYWRWLEQTYAATEQPAKALDMARDRFKAMPSRATFDAIRDIAQLPGLESDTWPGLRQELIATLTKRGDYATLVAIHLEAHEVHEALTAWKTVAASRGRVVPVFDWPSTIARLDDMVATAAADEFPDDAIYIYRDLAEQFIAHRQRSAYRQAAEYHEQVKLILERTTRGDEWPALITDLRQNHKTLRALRDELDTLGLK